MASKTDIGNMALGHIGISKKVANVDTEASNEARQIKRYFDTDRDAVLRMLPWPFATGYPPALGLVSGSLTAPYTLDWIFAHRYPSSALMVRRILTPAGRRETRPPAFAIARDDQGRLLLTNYQDTVNGLRVETTMAVTDTAEFDPLFVECLAWKLAGSIAPGLSRVEGAAEAATKMYYAALTRAASVAFDESQLDPAAEAEWIRARQGDIASGRGQDWDDFDFPVGWSIG